MAAAVTERLRRYVIRSKVKLELGSEWTVCGGGSGLSRRLLDSRGTGAGLDSPALRIDATRELVLAPASATAAATDPAQMAAWRLTDIARGIPVLTAAVADQFIPQALSLERLEAFSTTKGCYPGQEIVARTHFLGRSKRALARLAAERGAAPEAGARVVGAGGSVVGTLVSAAPSGAGFEALAVLHEEGQAGPFGLEADAAAELRRLDFDLVDRSAA
jgi:hypothetical protein